MGINIGVGSDPGSQGTINLEGSGAVAPVAPGAAPLSPTTNIMELSSIAPSGSASPSAAPEASSPALSAAVDSASRIAYALVTTQSEIANTILDNWAKQIQVQAAISEENYKRDLIKQEAIEKQDQQSAMVKENVEANQLKEQTTGSATMSAGPNFTDWWNRSSSVDKSNYLNTNGDRMIGAYLDTHNDAAIQNSDLAKGGIPAYVEMMRETLIVNPMAIDLAMRSSADLGSGSTLADELKNLGLPPSLMDIPQINLMLPFPLYASAIGTTLGLYGKMGAGADSSNQTEITRKFVDELAKKTLKNTETTDSWLRFKDPGFAQLPQDLQQSVVVAANLLALTTVLIFDIKAQGSASNLSPEEYASLLKNGNPDDPVLNMVLGRINSLFAQLEKSKPGEAEGYRDFVNNYIVAAQLQRFNIEDLMNFSNVLLYANSSIGEAERVLKRSA